MGYLANFQEVDGVLCRLDTRIYLESYNPSIDSVCVGAVVGKNPGSAMPSKLGELMPLKLCNDKMLPTVANRVTEAYTLAKKRPPLNSFVRVWNLFYICGKDLHLAANVAAHLINQPICESEEEAVPFIWFGWGGSDMALNPFKRRFIARNASQAFFYDHIHKKVSPGVPTEADFAKHTQGMPAAPIREHLAKIV